MSNPIISEKKKAKQQQNNKKQQQISTLLIISVLSGLVYNANIAFLLGNLTLALLNKLRCHAHFQFTANQITWSRLLIQIHILNGKKCRSRSVGFFRSQLIWIYTVCKGRTYPGYSRTRLKLKALIFFSFLTVSWLIINVSSLLLWPHWAWYDIYLKYHIWITIFTLSIQTDMLERTVYT